MSRRTLAITHTGGVVAAVLLTIGGCKGDGPAVSDPVSFAESTEPGALTGEVPRAAAEAHDAVQSLWGITSLVLTDGVAADLLAGGGATPEGACWSTDGTSVTVTIDYGNCSLDGISGTVDVARTPSQTVAISFGEPGTASFAYGNRGAVGRLGLIPVGGVDNLWLTESVEASGQPSTEPLSVFIGASQYDLVFEPDGARMALDFFNGRIPVWGNVEVTGPEGTQSVIVGATDPETAAQATVTPDSMKVPFFPTCRCATAGVVSLDTTLTLTEVELVLPRALVDAGTDWPTLPVPTAVEIPGIVTFTPGAGCGDWNGTFAPSTSDPIVLPGDSVRSAVEVACTANTFGSEERCERVRAGALALDGIALDITEEDWGPMMELLAETQLDNAFCSI